jgi:hypothetical protein
MLMAILMFVAASTFFGTSNYLEAALWGAIAVGFVIAAIRSTETTRARAAVAAVAFVAFGLSDVVEVQTGAWWRPWWLLAWKAACVAVFLMLYVDYLRRRKTRSMKSPSEAPTP